MDKIKKLITSTPENIKGLIISLPAAFLIYVMSIGVVGSQPIFIIIIFAGLFIPFIAMAMVAQWRIKEDKQYKNFDPNNKLPQCVVASTSSIISGIGIGSSVTPVINESILFNLLAILILGSFTILSIADNHGKFINNPKNDEEIRKLNNKLQCERMAIFIKDILVCLLIPFIASIVITYIYRG